MVEVVKLANLEVNPYWKHLGIKPVSGSDGKIIGVVLDVTKDLKQIYGTVHGGVLASLVDSAMAVAIHQQLAADEGCATVEMKLNYFRPVSEGRLMAEGKVIQKGSKIVVGQCEIRNDKGHLVAFGTGTFMINKITAKVAAKLLTAADRAAPGQG